MAIAYESIVYSKAYLFWKFACNVIYIVVFLIESIILHYAYWCLPLSSTSFKCIFLPSVATGKRYECDVGPKG